MDFIIAFCLVIGLILGGSDGRLFPWMNLVGVAMVFVAGMIAQREGRPE
jgi:hypothetical protein